MMNAPLISVMVPVYNTSRWLRRCLDSICAQTYRNLEILCVNDGSTDNSAEILAEYAKRKMLHMPARAYLVKMFLRLCSWWYWSQEKEAIAAILAPVIRRSGVYRDKLPLGALATGTRMPTPVPFSL